MADKKDGWEKDDWKNGEKDDWKNEKKDDWEHDKGDDGSVAIDRLQYSHVLDGHCVLIGSAIFFAVVILCSLLRELLVRWGRNCIFLMLIEIV